jgi:glutamyl-tRNA synthetase
MTVRVRFAPSPTGNLHIGTMRAALFNWLYAKHHNGLFILRIEDTDRQRSMAEYEKNILDGLAWLNLNLDEGPIGGGPYGPYRQSERIEDGLYEKYAKELVDAGKAYYCFLTTEDIEQDKERAKKAGIAYMHSRERSNLPAEELRQKIESGIPYVIRFKMTEDREIIMKDSIRGKIRFDCNLISDFVLIKSDGTPSYNFAVVIDDSLMKITHVIRGEDHVSNMPRQLALYEAFGFDTPEFAHLPMILGPDKSKLSKRHGATAATEYRDRGFLPEAFMNYLTLLGWSPVGEEEFFTAEQLCEQFDLDRVNNSGAVFDIKKLKWMNGQYIRKIDENDYIARVELYLNDSYKAQFQQLPRDKQVLALKAIRDNLDELSEVNEYITVFLESSTDYKTALGEINFSEQDSNVFRYLIQLIDSRNPNSPEEYSALLETLVIDLEQGKGKVFKPIRLGVTAKAAGPNISYVLAFFGATIIKERLLDLLK